MQLKYFALLLSAIVSTVVADNCSFGPTQCCQTVDRAGSSVIAPILASHNVVVDDPNILVGTVCSPITVGGSGTTTCQGQSVCCSNNDFNGVIVIGCVVVDV